jgi:C-8 sterol isomerase
MAHIFDPEVLQQIARDALGQPIEAMVAQIVSELSNRYPDHILPTEDHEWIFNNAGGAMGAMLVLHASISEYVIIFGTAIGTEGATGRFAADDWFTMLEGEQWNYAEGDLDRQVVKPGETAILRRGQSKAYRFPDKAWGLEYARGAIPLMLPFGLADTFSSTLDFTPLYRTLRIYTKATVGNLLKGKI